MNNEITTATITPALAVITTVVGITLWPFAVAFVFALCALVYQESVMPMKAFCSVLASTLLGGAIAQISAIPVLVITVTYIPSLTAWAQDAQIAMTAAIALLIGLLAHKVIPVLLGRIGKMGGAE